MASHQWLLSAISKSFLGLLLCLSAFADYVPVPDVSSHPAPTDHAMGVYREEAVVSNGPQCAKIGQKILEKYHSAPDALIATMLCEGVVTSQNMGVGGGFLLTGYKKSTGEVYILNAREEAPANSSENMFVNKLCEKASMYGGLAVGIPGELKGYAALYKKFGGKAPWAELFEDTIDLCINGFKVNKQMADIIQQYKSEIEKHPTLKKMLSKEDGNYPKEGEILKMQKLGETFKIIARDGVKALYDGSLTDKFVEDIQKNGGIITRKDMAQYRVRWEKPVKAKLSGGLTLHSVGPPGSGYILAFILRVLDGQLNTGDLAVDIRKISEAFKYGYSMRAGMGDIRNTSAEVVAGIKQVINKLQNKTFIKETRDKINKMVSTYGSPQEYGVQNDFPLDSGTANIAALDKNGDAVVATSTVNLVFGSMLVSESTGILLNDEMDDFSTPGLTNAFGFPPSASNFIAPGKRPMSSMVPSVILNSDGDVRLLIGCAGGSRITTSTAQTAIWNLWYGKNIKEALDTPRFHHQLMPMEWSYEHGNLKSVVDAMKAAGHNTVQTKYLASKFWTGNSAVTAISRNSDGTINAYHDPRLPGSVGGI